MYFLACTNSYLLTLQRTYPLPADLLNLDAMTPMNHPRTDIALDLHPLVPNLHHIHLLHPHAVPLHLLHPHLKIVVLVKNKLYLLLMTSHDDNLIFHVHLHLPAGQFGRMILLVEKVVLNPLLDNLPHLVTLFLLHLLLKL